MSQELHYTSLPRGLKPGTRGFCTVARTARMPGPLADQLENLSAYRPAFADHDAQSALNPINFSHVRLAIGGRILSVLSRIGPAPLDYTGRTNKYAHHVVLDPDERPEAGPAWLLGLPGFMQTAWEGEARELAEGRKPPRGDRPAGIAEHWRAAAGDAGWAGVLAESFLADPRRPVYLIVRPGMDVLSLFAEAIALLPPSRRWEVEFATYVSQGTQGTAHAWRGVLDGSIEAMNAARNPHALVINLCGPLEPARGGALVHLARTGERLEEPAAGPIATPRPATVWEPVPTNHQTFPVAEPPPIGAFNSPPPIPEFLPEFAARMALSTGMDDDEDDAPDHERFTAWIAATIAACLVVGLGTYFVIQRYPVGFAKERENASQTEVVRRDEETPQIASTQIKMEEPGDGTGKPTESKAPITQARLATKASPTGTGFPADSDQIPLGGQGQPPTTILLSSLKQLVAAAWGTRHTSPKPQRVNHSKFTCRGFGLVLALGEAYATQTLRAPMVQAATTPLPDTKGVHGPAKSARQHPQSAPPSDTEAQQQPNKPAIVRAQFFPLPKPGEVTQLHPETPKELKSDPPIMQRHVKNMELIGSNDALTGQYTNGSSPRLIISSKEPSSGTGSPNQELATFEVKDNMLTFYWNTITPSEMQQEDLRLLRDCVLKISLDNQNDLYCVLRDKPRSSEKKHIVLQNKHIKKYTFHWDKDGRFQDKFQTLELADCKLDPPGIPALTHQNDGSWAVIQEGGKPRVSVKLDNISNPKEIAVIAELYDLNPNSRKWSARFSAFVVWKVAADLKVKIGHISDKLKSK